MSLFVSKTITYTIDKPLFERLCSFVLGPEYELSLTLIGDARSRTLNRIYRHKDKPANVLSFPLNAICGEIYLNPRAAAREAKLFNRTTRQFVLDLFIHGLLHLKGLDHGSTMDRKEVEIRKRFRL